MSPPKKSPEKPLHRLIALDQLIRTGQANYQGRTIRTGTCPGKEILATKFRVSTKTIGRDIKVLKEEHGAPIAYKRAKGGYYYTEKGWSLENMLVTEGDLLSLLIARQMIEQYRGSPLAVKLDKIYDRLADQMTEPTTLSPESVSGFISIVPHPYPKISRRIWDPLLKSILRHRILRIEYRAGWDPSATVKTHHVKPYHIANLWGDWHLLAGLEDNTSIPYLQFNMARMLSARVVTNRGYKIPKSFDAKALLKNVFGSFISENKLEEVGIRFDKKIATLIDNRKWHPQQRLERTTRGDIDIFFPVSTEGPWCYYHVISWVLSWGEDAKVLRPEELKDKVAKEARKITNMY